MDMEREKLLKEVMAADFTVIDLNLYLNTHPCDQRAIFLYNKAVKDAQILRFNYEKNFGPLTAHSSFSGYPWKWIESPWPWE